MSRRRVLVVLGMMGRCPFAGQTWLYLNWLRGFHRLGHEVWYVEDDTTWPYDPVADTITQDPGYATRYLHRTLSGIGLGDRWAYRPRSIAAGNQDRRRCGPGAATGPRLDGHGCAAVGSASARPATSPPASR